MSMTYRGMRSEIEDAMSYIERGEEMLDKLFEDFNMSDGDDILNIFHNLREHLDDVYEQIDDWEKEDEEKERENERLRRRGL